VTDTAATAARGSWGSRFGFIMAASGSAIGIGNVWGFPMLTGQNGGAAFVVVYLVCVFLICFPILIAEIALGRATGRAPIEAFRLAAPRTAWWLTGLLGVVAGIAILSFYAVVFGWTAGYTWFAATGALAAGDGDVGAFFTRFAATGPLNIALSVAVLAVTGLILAGGVQAGIERAMKLLMPILCGLLILLTVRALLLPGAEQGLRYYVRPDFSKLTDPGVISAALGQAFFSLSLGIGGMLTYGSYLKKQENIAHASSWVTWLDTITALMAGLIVFPVGFSIVGFDPASSGPGLVFAVLPRLFASMPGGALFGTAFFVLLWIAALGSAISLLEVPTAALVDRGWSRRKAVAAVTAACAVLAIPSALATGANATLSNLPGLGTDFLSLMIVVWNNWALPIGGLLIAVFVGWVWGTKNALAELTAGDQRMPAAGLWVVLIRYVCPLAILFIIVMTARDMLTP
jgi:NSS family neurotransmitter:Na+ symporter